MAEKRKRAKKWTKKEGKCARQIFSALRLRDELLIEKIERRAV